MGGWNVVGLPLMFAVFFLRFLGHRYPYFNVKACPTNSSPQHSFQFYGKLPNPWSCSFGAFPLGYKTLSYTGPILGIRLSRALRFQVPILESQYAASARGPWHVLSVVLGPLERFRVEGLQLCKFLSACILGNRFGESPVAVTTCITLRILITGLNHKPIYNPSFHCVSLLFPFASPVSSLKPAQTL